MASSWLSPLQNTRVCFLDYALYMSLVKETHTTHNQARSQKMYYAWLWSTRNTPSVSGCQFPLATDTHHPLLNSESMSREKTDRFFVRGPGTTTNIIQHVEISTVILLTVRTSTHCLMLTEIPRAQMRVNKTTSPLSSEHIPLHPHKSGTIKTTWNLNG
jgi:hypothetical protein